MNFYLSIFLFACITTIGVMSVFMLTGLTGLFSFGQAAFMAVGAYSSGLLVIKLGVPFPIAIILGIVISMVVALIIGYPTLKLRRDYFTLITFGFGEAIAALLNYFVKITGGATGLTGIPRYTTPTLVIVSTVVIIVMIRNLKYSRFGRICIAIKNDELTAKSFGIDVFKMKLKMFILSSAIAAYAGILYGFLVSYVEPSMFRWSKSAEWVIFLFFGGTSSLSGAVTSSFILTALPETLRFASAYKVILYCVLVLITLNFRPKGLFGENEINFNWISKAVGKIKGKKIADSSTPKDKN